MRIAFVVHQFLPRHTTGTELYAFDLAQTLRRRGHEVEVFTGEDDERSLLRLYRTAYEGLPVWRFVRDPRLEGDPLAATYASPLAAAAFRRFLHTVRPQAVHLFHLQGLGLGVPAACKAFGIPYLVHLTDYWFLCPRAQMLDYRGQLCPGPEEARRCTRCAGQVDGNFAALAETLARGQGGGEVLRGLRTVAERWPRLRAVLREAAAVFAPSRYLADQYRRWGLPSPPLRHFPYGLSRRRVAQVPPRRRLPARVFGFVGNLAPFKGARLLLEAFRELPGRELRLEFHGDFFYRDPAEMEACRALAAADRRVRLCGPFPHEELPRVLGRLDVLVVPSLWHENTPFALLEALAAGIPCIVADVGGLTEAVRPGVDALLFPRGSVAGLRRALARLAAGEGLQGGSPSARPDLEETAHALERLSEEAWVARQETPPAEPEALAADLYASLERWAALFERTGRRARHPRAALRALARAERLQREAEGQRARAEALAREAAALRAHAAGLEKTLRAEREAQGRHAASLAADLEGHRRALAELRQEVEGLRQARAALAADLEGHRRALAEREQEVAALRAGLETMRREVSRLEAEGAQGRADLEAARAEAVRLRAERRDLEERVRVLEEALRAQEATLQALKERLLALAEEAEDGAGGPNL